MKTLKKVALILVVALSFATAAQAQIRTRTERVGDLVIYRTAPESAFVGQKIWVIVEIENEGTQERNIRFIERLGNANFDRSQAKFMEIYDPGPAGTPSPATVERPKIWYYEWGIKLSPKQRTSLAYWLVPTTPGMYVISPAQITVDGQVFYTASWDIQIRCKADGTCDAQTGENYLTCPEDCVTGAADGICDGALDGKVDPDCAEGFDPDAAPAPAATPTPAPEGLPGFPTPCWGIGAIIIIAIPVITLVVTRARGRPVP